MTPKQKLELRMSEVRSKLNELAGIEAPTEENLTEIGKLHDEFKVLETRSQAFIVAGDVGDAGDAPDYKGDAGDEKGFKNGTETTNASDKLADLERRASFGEIAYCVLQHSATTGAERELQAELGLSDNQIPLALLRGAGETAELETRAVTPAPADVGQNQQPIIPAVFPQSAHAWLGIPTPSVGVGESLYPVLTTSAVPVAAAKGAEVAETTGGFASTVLAPQRLQASFFYAREDRARFKGMAAALRENLSAALGDALDKQILVGAGNGLLTGTNLANHNVTAEAMFAEYRGNLAYKRVDGIYANTVSQLRILMGAATYAAASVQYLASGQGGANISALDDLAMRTGGVRVSAHVPAPTASHRQNAIVRRGMRRDAVAPIWEGITLIPDEITKAATGEIVLTAAMLYAFKILRTDGFYKQQVQVAA